MLSAWARETRRHRNKAPAAMMTVDASIIDATIAIRTVFHESNVVGEKHFRAEAVAVQDSAAELVDAGATIP